MTDAESSELQRVAAHLIEQAEEAVRLAEQGLALDSVAAVKPILELHARLIANVTRAVAELALEVDRLDKQVTAQTAREKFPAIYPVLEREQNRPRQDLTARSIGERSAQSPC